ncbi:hypothetical protein D3C87_2001950 [compost metagenome]
MKFSELNYAVNVLVQKAHLWALIGMTERHSGQALVVGSGAGSFLFILFAAFTIRKIAKAMITKSITALAKRP